MKGKTIISILHRLEAASEFDQNLVLEKGKVVGCGTPEEVARRSELFSGVEIRP
jgi:ABC-type multidrug transport system fused ATPase/permease subunit